ncbi:MAG TPA: VIT1/CCC1 transporter family protein [Acidobacteriaceae bacterium]|jgi:VIT1/CCC1 family predicted Fe2+/Mn2+ transporter|nr:VIT1/CCC1 transporter family protein [Acidobacteriaceae bacterium]
MNPRDQQRLIEAIASNWQAEMRGFHTYNTLSQHESDPHRRRTLRNLALAEKHHAELWQSRLTALGAPAPTYDGPAGGDAHTLANRIGGPGLALRRLEIDESRDIARYAKQIEQFGDPESVAVLKEVIADEADHHLTLAGLIRNHLPARAEENHIAQQALDDLVAARDKGQPRAASWIGDAIYGVNDGLGAIFGIVSGVSGATLGNAHFVLIAGLAGMIASALSMGSGAYLAAKSEREIYEAEFAREREAVEYNEAEARELLSLTYQVRGLSEEDAESFVTHIAQNKEQLVQALARERLHTTEEGLADPWVSATSGAISTAVGAFIPIIPFFFMAGIPAIVAAAIISLAAHFAVGAAKSLITIRSWWASGLEMTAIGAIEGAVTYALGIALGKI